jgi:hypothetical protein
MDTKVEFKPHSKSIVDIAILTKDPDIIKIYSNGYQCGFTVSDVNIVLKQNDVSVGVLILPLSGLKTLHTQMGKLIENYKKYIGKDILSIEELIPPNLQDPKK